jgi:hypothetical protein
VYATVPPPEKLAMSQGKTAEIGRNLCRQRHWFGCFERKPIIVSKAKEMAELTRALLHEFLYIRRHDWNYPLTGGTLGEARRLGTPCRKSVWSDMRVVPHPPAASCMAVCYLPLPFNALYWTAEGA